ncbi:MAG: Fic family protein [Caldilineaceae bacterium]
MNIELFRQSPSGSVIRHGYGDAAYWAFVPHPLPPKLMLDLPLVQALSSADRALGELAGLGRNMPNPHLLIQPFIRREAVLSSRIEGTQADVADLYAYEAGQLMLPGFRAVASESDVREVLNYVHALEYGLERIKEFPLSLRVLRELHERLMRGTRGEHLTPGEFRRTQNWIGGYGVGLQDAAYVPPPVDEMNDALGDFERYLHVEGGYPPLVRLGLIHYQFEAIHPFLDGNGRIGRLLITLLLVHWDLLPLPLLYLSAYFEEQRQHYYDRLMNVSTQGDWHSWLTFFLTGVTEQANDAIQRAKKLQDLAALWQSQLQQTNATALMHHVANLLAERPILSAQDICTNFDVSHQTAMRAIQRLIEIGILAKIDDRRRNQHFLARQIVEIIQNSDG